MDEPRLRTANKIIPPYPLGEFPPGIIVHIAGRIVYLLYTRGQAQLEGTDWENIFASSIDAEWKPSNIGLDDVVLRNCCWGAKTVKNRNPSRCKQVRLISGRNSLDFSFNKSNVREMDPLDIGRHVLSIWNMRVSSVRERFEHCRTVVLIKAEDLHECAIFEFETLRYDATTFSWKWNANNNLEGYDNNGKHKFTWQPHGSQFTIIENVPKSRKAFMIKIPEKLSIDIILKDIGFDASWVTILD